MTKTHTGREFREFGFFIYRSERKIHGNFTKHSPPNLKKA